MPATGDRLIRNLAPVAVAGAAVLLGVVVFRLAAWDGPATEFGQPLTERAAQRRLPQSDDPIWPILKRTKVHEDARAGLYTAEYPAAVTALVGRTLSVDGFMLPLDSKSESHHFLLSRYTPVCFFCPPGEPNEVLEVFSSGPIVPTTDEVTVTGRFGLQRDSGMGLFFRLDDADVD